MPAAQVREAIFADPIYAQNSRVLYIEGVPDCWLVDPGFSPSPEGMLNFLKENRLHPAAIVLTHAHADHIAGIPAILEHYPDITCLLSKVEWSFLGDPAQNLSTWGTCALSVEVNNLAKLEEGQELNLGGSAWRIFDTSGHSPGGRTLYCAEEGIALVGDALFAGSVGRTDFPHSDPALLISNIREKLLTLPGDTRVLSGHGPDTTIDVERRTNPFVGERA